MMSKVILLFYFTIIIFLSSCVSGFKLAGDRSNIKGPTLAVIAGLKNQPTILFAEYLTKELQKISTFKVLSQDEIKNRLENYPSIIKGPYSKFSLQEIIEDYNNTDLEKINEIQRKLGVDNLLVIWAPITLERSEQGYGTTAFEIHSINQLFSFPGCIELGRGEIEAEYFSGLVIGVKVPRNINDAINRTVEYLAKNIAKETGMENTANKQ